jgi:hypothetical protein
VGSLERAIVVDVAAGSEGFVETIGWLVSAFG